MLVVFLVLVGIDTAGISLVYWLAAQPKWAERFARLRPSTWVSAVLAMVVLPMVALIVLFLSQGTASSSTRVLAGPFADGILARSPEAKVLGFVLLVAIAAFPVRPRWWTALIAMLAASAWMMVGVVVEGAGC